jgi:hypothetical protein
MLKKIFKDFNKKIDFIKDFFNVIITIVDYIKI